MQLPIGARFEFEGIAYIKSSALLATPEASGPGRMIPRWARISGPDAGSAAAGPAADEIDADRLRRAFEAYHAACAHWIDALGPEARAAIEAARTRFWASLDSLPPAGD